jgi:protein-tyrosine phosphatase
MQQQRRLDFEGAVNFRDLGGYPAGLGRSTRWRRLYRADSLADLSEADLGRLESLGLAALVDFRIRPEREAKPDRLPKATKIKRVELGFIPAGTLEMLALVKAGAIDPVELERRVIGQYRLFCVDHHAQYREAFALAASGDNYPLLLHCTSGKDRTGYGIALLLLAVGVPRETALEDYDLTNAYRRAVPQLFGPQTSPEIVKLLLSAQPKYLEAALDEIDKVHGSFDAYLERALGVDDAARAKLVELLTEAT